MKKKKNILLFLFFISFTALLSSCDNEEEYEKLDKKENIVRFKVFCNNPVAHVKVWGGKESPIVIMGSWEETTITERYIVELRATSDDKLSTVKIQCFVNRKLFKEKSDYGDVDLRCKIK